MTGSVEDEQKPFAYSYQRLSSDVQLKGGGLERQQSDAEKWCAHNFHRLDDTINLVDAGRSAFSGAHLEKGYLGQLIALAEKGHLGSSWVLLIEAVDRISRLEPLDALGDVFLKLARTGCRIIDLEDGQEYSQATLNTDSLALVKLSLKIQAAHDYSKRLSRRISAHWEQTNEGIRNGTQTYRGGNDSKGGRCPFWVELDAERNWVLNEKAVIAKLLLQLAMDKGLGTVAAELNKRPDSGREWAAPSVKRVCDDPAVYGSRRMGQYQRLLKSKAIQMWEQEKLKSEELNQPFRKEHPGPIPEIEIVPNIYPPLISYEEFEQLQRTIKKRTHSPVARATHQSGIGNTCLQGLIRCTKGSNIGLVLSKPQRGEPRRYFRCRRKLEKRCDCEGGGAWEHSTVEAHVLTRLNHHLLGEAAIPGTDQKAELASALEKKQHQDHRAAEAKIAVDKAQEKFEWAMDNGTPDFAENASNLLEKRRATLRAAQAKVSEAAGEIDRIKARLNPAQELNDDAGMNLLRSIARGEETQSQRQQLHAVLVKADLQITLDARDPDNRRVGMRFGSDSEIEWEPLMAQARRLAAWMGANRPTELYESKDGNHIRITRIGSSNEREQHIKEATEQFVKEQTELAAETPISKETWESFSDEERTLLAEFDPTKDK